MIKNLKYIALLISVLILLTSCEALNDIPTFSETEYEESESEAPLETEPEEPKKRVALTFDDGPAYDNETSKRLTYKIVDKLAEYGGKATFFLVGNRINTTTGAAIAYAYEHGSEIGIHAYTHDYNFSTCSTEVYLNELEDTKNAIIKYAGVTPTVFRPPYGSLDKSRAELSGYPVIMWNIDSEDWRYRSISTDAVAKQNVDTIVDKIMSEVEDGDIILMHEIYKNSCDAALIVIDRLSAEGYEFVTVSELLGDDMTAGSIYYNAE